MMLVNAVSHLPDSPDCVTYPELLHDLSKLVNACRGPEPQAHIRPGSNRLPATQEKGKRSTSTALDWSECVKLFRWLTSAVSAVTTSGENMSKILNFLSILDEFLTRCRDQRLLSQSEQVQSSVIGQSFSESLNLLLRQLLQLLCYLSETGERFEANRSGTDECYNLTSKIVGHLVLGNLTQIDPNVLSDLTRQFVTELRLRRAATDLLQSRPIYVTLSHLVYLHAVWDKTQDGIGMMNPQSIQLSCMDFLVQAPELYESMVDTFADCLKRCNPYVLRTASQDCDTERSAVVRQVVMACLNGLSQLLLRRTPKPSTTALPSVVRVLWSHVLVFSRQCASGKRGIHPGAESIGALDAEACSGSSSPSSYRSPSSSLPATSDEEAMSSSPRLCSDMPWAVPEWSWSHAQSYSNNSSTGLSHPDPRSASFYSSSEDESNSCALVPGTTEAIASGLLTGSPYSAHTRPSLHRRRNPPRHPGGIDSPGRSHAPPFGFANQLKPYALSVFCLKRLLDGCRSQSALDLWSSLMCCDAWAGMGHLSDRTSPFLTSSLAAGATTTTTSTERPPATTPTPDLLTLVYKTSDMRIRKMLVEVLVSLLASVGKRFAIAEDLTPHSASFVPYSVRLAVELRHLHRRLVLALYSEKSIVLQGLLLKALTTLVLITPYPRLQPGLLTSLMPVLHQLVHLTGTHNRIVDLRAGCLNLLGNILGRVPGPLLEVCQILSDDSRPGTATAGPVSAAINGPSTARPRAPPTLGWSSQTGEQTRGPGYWSGSQSQDPFSPCWLVQVCLRLIHPNVSSFAWDQTTQPTDLNATDCQGFTNPTELCTSSSPARHFQPAPVRIQALTVLRNMVPNYVAFLKPSLPLVKKTLLFCLQDSSKTKILWSSALKFLLVFLPFLQTDSSKTNNAAHDCAKVGTDSMTWWRDFIPPMVHILRNSKESSDRSYCCKVLAFLDATTLEDIYSEEQSSRTIDSVVHALEFAAEDEDEPLQARAVRTLGALIVLGPLQKNLSLLTYLIDRAETVWSKASNQSVGLDVAWSLANCLEVIVAHKVGLIPNGLDWDSVIEQLNGFGVDWTRLIRTCCELCALHPTEPNQTVQCSEYDKRNASVTADQGTIPSQLLSDTGTGVAVTDSSTENPKSPDAHRCENGARALGYLFRILSPRLIQDQKMINMLFESMCEAMVTNKASSAEKIRWNANFAVGHLFQNDELWCWWSKHFNGARPVDHIADPLGSMETARLIAKLIRHLCHTFGQDKYFKARVYAANSLLGLFIHGSMDDRTNALHIVNSQLLRTETNSDPPILEFSILSAAFTIIRQVHDGNTGAPCCAEHGQSDRSFHTGSRQAGTHLSESQYRHQCLHLATTLMFYSLTSWITYASQHHHPSESQDLQAQLEHQLTSSWLCPVVLSHLVRQLQDCMISTHQRLETDCKPEAIYPRPTIVSHLLELNDKTSPNKRLQQAVQLFRARAAVSQWTGPAVQRLIQLIQEAENLTDPTVLHIVESQSKLTLSARLSDASQFRQIYD